MHPWFTKANKLRFLQANKFKMSKTVESIEEASKWRKRDFPVSITPEVREKLVIYWSNCVEFWMLLFLWKGLLLSTNTCSKLGEI